MENSLSKLGELKKGLFDQKGGVLGMILLAVGAVFFITQLPAIVAFVDSLFHLVIVGAATAGVLYVLFDPKVRNLVGTLYMMGIRSLLGMVIKLNPIAILEDTINKMYKSIAKVEDNMGKLNGIKKKLEEKIVGKKKELETCLQRKRIAEEKGKKEVVMLEDRQSVRLLDLVKDYIELHDSTENWYKTLSKIADMANLTVKDAENEVQALKERYEMVKISHNAFKSAMSIIKGDPDQLAMYNQAFDYVNDDIMFKLGEMDRVINTTGGMLDKMDIEKELYSIKGGDISKKYEELGLDALFTKFESLPSQKMAALMAHPTTTIDLDAIQSMQAKQPEAVKNQSKYF